MTKQKYVLIRTHSAGVHFGKLVSRKGQEVVLKDARRIWSWQGANSLNEIANRGVGKGSKLSEPVSGITLTQAIEVLDMKAEAVKSLSVLGWGQ